MIRIDEIYTNVFWPWFKRHRPGSRLFFCDPFGHTDPEHLYNHGKDNWEEAEYIFMHDQEPVQIDAHRALFEEVVYRNIDMLPRARGHVIVSEKGANVKKLCDIYGWTSHYYFFHGWACLDWYRGYDKTYLFTQARDRRPTRTFMSPNRIMGGEREHRVLFLYHCARQSLLHNNISAPDVCPSEGTPVIDIAKKYQHRYPDIVQRISDVKLPLLFHGESEQMMTSCWLGNFAEVQDSLIYVPTETVYFGDRLHITEKTFKAIALGMPWILVAPAGSLAYMKSYGFKTFDSVWDESYDNELDDLARLERVTDLLAQIDRMSAADKIDLHMACLPIVEHNWNHFYQGGLEHILWQELNCMLESVQI